MRIGIVYLHLLKEFKGKRIMNYLNKNMAILRLHIEALVLNLSISQGINLGKETKAYK